MPVPTAVTGFNKRVLNPVMRRLAGHGWFVELEHVGRSSGRTFRTPLMAFRAAGAPGASNSPGGTGDRGTVTIALTYGPDVDWLRNVRAGGGARMHLGAHLLTLGAPVSLSEQEGLRRMPSPPRQMLPVLGCHDFVELPVLDEQRWGGPSHT